MYRFNRHVSQLFYLGALLVASAGGYSSALADDGLLSADAVYTYSPGSNYPLTMDPGDAIQLTDGVIVNGHFWKSKKTVGWYGTGLITIEIRLDEAYVLDRLCMRTARGQHAQVSFPAAVDIFTSRDQHNYAFANGLYQPGEQLKGGYKVERFCTRLDSAGQYVMLKIMPSGEFGYTFIDEIEIYGARLRQSDKHTYPIAGHDIDRFLIDKNRYINTLYALKQEASALMADWPDAEKLRITRLEETLSKSREFDLEDLQEYSDELLVTNQRLEGADDAGLIVRRVSPWINFTRFDWKGEVGAADVTMTSQLFADMNDVHSVVLTNSSADKAEYLIEIETVEDTGKHPDLSIKEVLPVVAASYEIIGDALAPYHGARFTLMPGESRQFWVNIYTGASDPGLYEQLLMIKKESAEVVVKMPVRTTVLDSKLEMLPAYANAWAYLNSRLPAQNPEASVQDLYKHNVNVAILHPGQIPWPRKQGDGTWSTDYKVLDRYIEYIRSSKILLLFLNFNNPKVREFHQNLKFDSDEWQTVFSGWVSGFRDYLVSRDIALDKFAFYPVDEPVGKNVDILLTAARQIKSVDDRLRVYTTMTRSPDHKRSVELHKVVDIFQLNTRYMPVFDDEFIQRYDPEYWLYAAHGGGKQADPVSYYRILPWRAWRYGMKGAGFWSYADIGPTGDAWNDFDGVRPDFSVIYEVNDDVIGSKRWDAWMLGIEDLRLLRTIESLPESVISKQRLISLVDGVLDSDNPASEIEAVRSQLITLLSSNTGSRAVQ